MQIFETDCKEWIGYKPCNPQILELSTGCDGCKLYDKVQGNILVIECGGLGSALRTSTVTKELKRLYPSHIIHWLTQEKVRPLIEEHVPSVDLVYTATWQDLLVLESIVFSLVINYESDLLCLAFVKRLQSKKAGYTLNSRGKQDLASESANEFLRLQTDDEFRRRENQKSMQQILLEVAGYEWKNQSYDLRRSLESESLAKKIIPELPIGCKGFIGLNIGSAEGHNAKRWQPEHFYELVSMAMTEMSEYQFIILAGPEDASAYSHLDHMTKINPLSNIHFIGYDQSISTFISLIDMIPLIVSADTFGLHVAIGLGKKTISLWGPQPINETLVAQKEVKITLDLECAPCFASTVDKCKNSDHLACMKQISPRMVLDQIMQIVNA